MHHNLGLLCLSAVIGLAIVNEGAPAHDDDKQAELPVKEFPLPPGYTHNVVFSPDGATMAIGVDSFVVIWNVAERTETRVRLPAKELYHHLSFSKDGKSIIWTGRRDPLVR